MRYEWPLKSKGIHKITEKSGKTGWRDQNFYCINIPGLKTMNRTVKCFNFQGLCSINLAGVPTANKSLYLQKRSTSMGGDYPFDFTVELCSWIIALDVSGTQDFLTIEKILQLLDNLNRVFVPHMMVLYNPLESNIFFIFTKFIMISTSL